MLLPADVKSQLLLNNCNLLLVLGNYASCFVPCFFILLACCFVCCFLCSSLCLMVVNEKSFCWERCDRCDTIPREQKEEESRREEEPAGAYYIVVGARW